MKNIFVKNVFKRCKEMAEKGYSHTLFISCTEYKEFKKLAEKEGYFEKNGKIEFPSRNIKQAIIVTSFNNKF